VPPKFQEHEKKRIRQKLLEEGRRRFETHGLRKTSVEDLTKAAGISQGAFYLFFESKEALFYELLLDEEYRIRGQLMRWAEEEAVTAESVRKFITESFRLISESALIRTMHLQGGLEQLVRKLPPEKLERNLTEDLDAMLHVVRKWQEAGILREERPELIVSMFRSIMLLSLHRKEIGETVYSDTIDLLVRVLVAGLCGCSAKEVPS